MRHEQLIRCSDALFKDKLLEIGLSLNKKSQDNGQLGVNCYFVDIPFASDYFEIDPQGKFAKIFETKLFRRQEKISQLQFLVHEDNLNSSRIEPELFQHQRSEHARLAACLGAAILLRHSVEIDEVLRFAVTAAYHDSATPAGGDTVIRLNRHLLCEERNFSSVMHEAEMDKLFADFSFSTKQAQVIVYGHGMHGKLLDFVDKLSYTLLDAHYGLVNGLLISTIERCLSKNLFFGNVWLDVMLTQKRPSFTHTRRLYCFLVIRALMHDGLYRNPVCRKLEIVYTKAISDDLNLGKISCENLMRNTDHFLKTRYDHLHFVKKAKKIRYRSFKEGPKVLNFMDQIGDRLVYMEEMAPFNPGLNWLVKRNGIFRSLQDMLFSKQIANLDQLAKHRHGWHLYFI